MPGSRRHRLTSTPRCDVVHRAATNVIPVEILTVIAGGAFLLAVAVARGTTALSQALCAAWILLLAVSHFSDGSRTDLLLGALLLAAGLVGAYEAFGDSGSVGGTSELIRARSCRCPRASSRRAYPRLHR